MMNENLRNDAVDNKNMFGIEVNPLTKSINEGEGKTMKNKEIVAVTIGDEESEISNVQISLEDIEVQITKSPDFEAMMPPDEKADYADEEEEDYEKLRRKGFFSPTMTWQIYGRYSTTNCMRRFMSMKTQGVPSSSASNMMMEDFHQS